MHNIRDNWNKEAKRRAKLLLAGKDVKIGSTDALVREAEAKNAEMEEKMAKRDRQWVIGGMQTLFQHETLCGGQNRRCLDTDDIARGAELLRHFAIGAVDKNRAEGFIA